MAGDPDFSIKVGDTAPDLELYCEDANGNRVDIQGATVKFVMASVGGGTAKVDAAAQNRQVGTGSDGTKGKVGYPWVAGNTDTADDFYGEMQVTFAGGALETFPNDRHLLIRMREDLS